MSSEAMETQTFNITGQLLIQPKTVSAFSWWIVLCIVEFTLAACLRKWDHLSALRLMAPVTVLLSLQFHIDAAEGCGA
jgi:hypothetical protein